MPWLEPTLLLLSLAKVTHRGLLVLGLRLKLRLISPIALKVTRCAPPMTIRASSSLEVVTLSPATGIIRCHRRWELEGSATTDR